MKEIEVSPSSKINSFYTNPSGINDIGDPYVIKAGDGFYYMYCTSAEDGYYCWKSADLVHWTDKKMAYKKSGTSWATVNFWAPEVIFVDGIYYMYYTAMDQNRSLRIGVAASSSPDDPFEEVLEGPLFDFGYAAIDAHVFIDEDDQKYLYYSRDCSENEQNGIKKSEIYGIRLGDDMISVIGEPVLLLTPSQRWEMASFNPLWNEGPTVLKKNGTYYLSYSGNCYASSTYAIGYATSDSPLGEYTKSEDNPILTSGSYQNISGPGHHSFTVSPDEKELFIVYHTHTDPEVGGGNRQVNIDRVVFTEDGKMHVNGPTISLQPAPSSDALTNVALSAKVTYQREEISLLTDGIFTIHRKDEAHDWVCNLSDHEPVKLTLSLEEEHTISSILVYRGTDKTSDFESFDVAIDGRYIIKNCRLDPNMDQRAAIASFEPRKAKHLEFTLYPRENSKKISISEIMVLGGSKN